MSISNIVISYSVISGFMASLLIVFSLFFEKERKKSRNFLIWSVFFLVSSFATSEYAFWLEGYNLFEFIFFNFPLIIYFGIWFVFIVWIFEKRKERKIWVIFLILLITIILIATRCMNCIRF